MIVTTELTAINCGKCGGTYAINERYRMEKEEVGGSWSCPYCKIGWGYGESELARERKAKERVEQQLQRERASHDQTRADRDRTESRRRAEKAAKTRIKNRVGRGVCPCCTRSFQNLAAHMATKHPDFTQKADAEEAA